MKSHPSFKSCWSGFRRLLRAAIPGILLCAFAAFAPHFARAEDPANNSDSITVRITPVVDVGVEIDTAAVNLSYILDLGATQYTLTPATVTILGNVNPQELDISAANISASPIWLLDSDELAALDELQLYALFSVGRSTQPLEAEFSGAKNLVTTAVKRAGQQGGDGGNQNFENNGMLGGADMDRMNVGTQRQLWFRMDMPPLTSTTDDQDIQITITATRSAL